MRRIFSTRCIVIAKRVDRHVAAHSRAGDCFPARSTSRSCESFISPSCPCSSCSQSFFRSFFNRRRSANGSHRKRKPSSRSTRSNWSVMTCRSAGARTKAPVGRRSGRHCSAALRQIIALQPLGIEREDGVGLLREPFALRWRLENERKDDCEQDKHGKDREIEFPQLLFVDLAGKRAPALLCAAVPIDRVAVALHLGEQMWRVRRRDPLRGEMTADVQISRDFSVPRRSDACARASCIASCCARLFSFSVAIARFEFAAHPRDIFFRPRQVRFGGVSFSLAQATGLRAPQARPRPFRAFFRQDARGAH